jgi:hypothetical protein
MFERDDYLLDGIEPTVKTAAGKVATPMDFAGEIRPIWSIASNGDCVVLTRPEDPFGQLRDAIEQHKSEEADIQQDLIERADSLLTMRDSIEARRKRAGLEDLTAPVRQQVDGLEDRIEQHAREKADLAAEIERQTDETVSLIDLFRGRENTAARAKTKPRGLTQDEKTYAFEFRLKGDPTKGLKVTTPCGPGKVTEFENNLATVELDSGEIQYHRPNRLRLVEPKKARKVAAADWRGQTPDGRGTFYADQSEHDPPFRGPTWEEEGYEDDGSGGWRKKNPTLRDKLLEMAEESGHEVPDDFMIDELPKGTR